MKPWVVQDIFVLVCVVCVLRLSYWRAEQKARGAIFGLAATIQRLNISIILGKYVIP